MADADDTTTPDETPEVEDTDTEDTTDEGQEPEAGSDDADGADGSEDGEDEGDDTSPEAIFKAKKQKLDNENRNLRTSIADLKAKLKAYEDKDLSDKERLERDLGETGQTVAELRAENNKLKVQRDFPEIDDDVAELLDFSDLEAALEKAKKISAKLAKPAAGKPRTPAKDLKGGSNPDKESGSTDARAAVADIPR